ncbi:MAG TPA: TlpA disulfide reductase family protein [Opitutaceae bacterium]|nr:TlpA disulfide reductase family protein [Opitutaceae bacterium]
MKLELPLFALVALAIAPAVCGGELRAFDAKSLAEIRQTYAGRPFVLAFWSIHCAPCKEEMGTLAALKKKFPGVPVVLVATDPPSAKPAVVRYLAGQKLGGIETWAFADEFAEKVRFGVDRKWHGELPRTYFFDAQHESTAHSGVIDPAWAQSWLAERTAPKAKR